MDEQTKDTLVTELRAYLDALPEAPETPGSTDTDGDARAVDLYTLLTEMAGLRNEVRLESRQVKRALDEFNGVFSTLEDNSKRLGSALDTQQANHAAAVANAERTLLLDMIDLRDRLTQARDLADGHQPGALRRRLARPQLALIRDLADGLGITLRRLDQALAQYGVAPIKVMGQALDPHRMRVTAVQADASQADATVLEEVRRGYQRGDEVLRLAEVVANRIQATE